MTTTVKYPQLFYFVTDKTTSMSVFLIVGRNVRWSRRILPLVSHVEYADGTDRQMDGRRTFTLCFPLDEARIIMVDDIR